MILQILKNHSEYLKTEKKLICKHKYAKNEYLIIKKMNFEASNMQKNNIKINFDASNMQKKMNIKINFEASNMQKMNIKMNFEA